MTKADAKLLVADLMDLGIEVAVADVLGVYTVTATKQAGVNVNAVKSAADARGLTAKVSVVQFT